MDGMIEWNEWWENDDGLMWWMDDDGLMIDGLNE